MNESVELAGGPELMRNSLILTGLTFRIFSAIDSDCFVPLIWFVQEASAARSPLKASGPEVTLKVALTVAPGATGPSNVFDESVAPLTTEVHWLLGTEMLSVTPAAGAPVVFVKVTVVSCEEFGVKIWSPGGALVDDAGAKLSGSMAYLASTMLACTIWSVASAGNVPAAVIAPS